MLYRHLRAIGIAGLASLLLGAVPAKASLIEDEVSCSTNEVPSYFCDTPTATVGAGPEFFIRFGSATGGDRWIVDIDASSVTFSLPAGVSLTAADDTIFLTGLEWVGMPDGEIVDINFINMGTNLSAAAAGYDSHSVFLDVVGRWGTGSSVTLELITTHVPEPGTLALFGLGLAGLGFARRKRAV